MAIPVPIIDATGIHIPAFADILAGFQQEYRGVYGADVYLEPDSQDGQWIGIQAKSYADLCAVAADVYNAMSPSTAQGVGLSRVVKINGLRRQVPSFSTVDLTLIGQAGIEINNGQAQDLNGNLWSLPISVVIPLSGEIVATGTCTERGAITARTGTVTKIATPTAGWQSVTNKADATSGAPVETDVALRSRQAKATSIPANTSLAGVVGNILALTGVTNVKPYENDTAFTDDNGLPPHSIAIVVDGGDDTEIATAISRKATGCYTYGTTSVTLTDRFGVPKTIRFFRSRRVPITYVVTIRKRTGYTTDVANAIKQAMADFTNAVGIGNSVRVARAYVPANLTDAAKAVTYDVVSVTLARDGAPTQPSDSIIAFNEEPLGDVSYVQIAFAT